MKRSDKQSDKRIRIGLYLDANQLKSLESISQKTGAPVSELIRRAIDAYLKKGA